MGHTLLAMDDTAFISKSAPACIAQLRHNIVTLLLTTCIATCNALAAEKSDVLMQEPRAGVLRPSFCLVRDDQLHCIVLAIRGTHSLKVIT